MSYIYDILLNFNKHLIEYFEWEDSDDIKYVKKIMLFKTEESTLKNIIENVVLLDSSFTSNIPKYEINNLKENKMCLLTDGKLAIGILIDNNKVEYISRMLLDEEYDALISSNNLVVTDIKYKIINKRIKNNNTLTRNESKIKELLLVKLDKLYNSKNIDALIYLYYEYSNKESRDIDYIYNYLIKSLESFNDKHIHLFNILSLSRVKAE